ncbi:MAG: hypothetical protein KAS96_06650 [Planctomycetes bacterium]|nr:hypothetical protein [Planctomycetota bacterium]
MKIKRIIVFVLVVLTLRPLVVNVYGNRESSFSFEALMKSTEIFGSANLFCESSEDNYVFRTSELIVIPVNQKPKRKSIKVTILKWENNSWQEYGLRKAALSDGQLEISSRVSQGGLYKLKFEISNNKYEAYAIICDGWKKVIFRFCRVVKDHLEINSDPQLLRSTIAVSHFDNVMELAADSEKLSSELFVALRKAIKGRGDFDNGGIPDFVIPGLTKVRLKRFKADDISEFIIYIPDDYSSDKKHSLVARVDPLRYNILNDYDEDQTGMIDLWWHFGSEKSFDWKDFNYFFKIMNEKLTIDTDRIYLHSICGNSKLAMAIALKYPDIWAGCMMSTGYNSIQLAGNMFNAQFFYANAHPEIEAHKPKINFVVKLYRYFGCDDFNLAAIKDIGKAHLVDFTKLKFRKNPDNLYFKTQSYQSNKSYWLSIDGCEDDNFFRTIEAEIKENKIFVTTENTDAYKIYLSKAPIDTSVAVEIIENNKSLGFYDEDVFVRVADRYTKALITKTPQIAGPIEDAFSEPHVIVYQSRNSEPNYLSAVADFAGKISPLAKCIKDSDFDKKYIDSSNIIFVGRDSENPTISKILKKLPVSITPDSIIADAKKYQAENAGCIMIYPNPLNTSKYILLFAPASELAANSMEKVFAEVKSEKDIAIFQADKKRNIKYHILENFNSVWQWNKNAGLVVFNNNFKKTAEDYQKLIAKTVKNYLNADISLLEPVFTADEHIPSYEKVTLRGLFANLQNHWIIKIRIKGSFLKQLVNKLLVGDAIERKTTYALCGISFSALSANDGLLVTEIENDKDYIIALSARAIKNPLLGYVLTDYEILDQSLLIKLLKDCSQKTGPIDLNQKCENIKIF